MTIIDHGTFFNISFPFGQWFNRNLEAVKALPSYRWIADKKYWYVPGNCRAEVLELKITHRAEIVVAGAQLPQQLGVIPDLPELTIPYQLKEGAMRHYQEQGVAKTIEFKRCINGDEQGLGKTLQSIMAATLSNNFPCVVVCPASVKMNWQREWHKWTDKRAMILDDKVKNTWHRYWETGMIDVFIVNYESLKKYFVKSMPEKKKLKRSDQIEMKASVELIKGVIIDESHRAKDPTTLQSKLLLRLCNGKEYVNLLSGTPVQNRPNDLWPQLAIMGHLNTFGGKRGFLDRYCEGGRGANNLRELNFLLNKHCFFRREKKDVAKDLPEKQRQTIICDITTRTEYETAKHEFEDYLRANGCTDREVAKKMQAEILVKMGVLKAISARGKMNEVKEFVEEILDSGEKLVLFCNLHSIVDMLMQMFPKAGTITGRDSMEARQRHIDNFQNDPKCQLIVCNIKAAGVGITLTASSRVAFVEYPWTYSDCVQCEDRTHRIGQPNNVMCTYFLGGNTIDEKMYEIIQEKRHIANTITGASDTMEMVQIDKMLNLFNI